MGESSENFALAEIAGKMEVVQNAVKSQPWSYLLRHLPQRLSCPPDALPHWSRFVSQTGVTSFEGGPDIKWLQRREPAG